MKFPCFVSQLVGWSVIISSKGEKFHLHAPIGAVILSNLELIYNLVDLHEGLHSNVESDGTPASQLLAQSLTCVPTLDE